MIVEMQEFMSEQTQALADQVEKFRKNPQRFMRKALVDSAEGLSALKRPVRMVSHSGVKLTAVSQNTLASLIELQSEVLTSAMTAVATRLERAADAEGIVALMLDQAKCSHKHVSRSGGLLWRLQEYSQKYRVSIF